MHRARPWAPDPELQLIFRQLGVALSLAVAAYAFLPPEYRIWGWGIAAISFYVGHDPVSVTNAWVRHLWDLSRSAADPSVKGIGGLIYQELQASPTRHAAEARFGRGGIRLVLGAVAVFAPEYLKDFRGWNPSEYEMLVGKLSHQTKEEAFADYLGEFLRQTIRSGAGYLLSLEERELFAAILKQFPHSPVISILGWSNQVLVVGITLGGEKLIYAFDTHTPHQKPNDSKRWTAALDHEVAVFIGHDRQLVGMHDAVTGVNYPFEGFFGIPYPGIQILKVFSTPKRTAMTGGGSGRRSVEAADRRSYLADNGEFDGSAELYVPPTYEVSPGMFSIGHFRGLYLRIQTLLLRGGRPTPATFLRSV